MEPPVQDTPQSNNDVKDVSPNITPPPTSFVEPQTNSDNASEQPQNTDVTTLPEQEEAVSPIANSNAVLPNQSSPTPPVMPQSQQQITEEETNTAPIQQPPIQPANSASLSGDKSDVYSDICTQIIREQEQIIGNLAVEQANYIQGLTIDPTNTSCKVTGDGVKVIDDLIGQYQDFFGHAAVEVCREAASQLLVKLQATEIPASLR